MQHRPYQRCLSASESAWMRRARTARTAVWRLSRRHSLHAIAGQLAPAPGCTGIEVLYADTFNLHCFQTLTGTKFLMVVKPDTPDVEEVLRTL